MIALESSEASSHGLQSISPTHPESHRGNCGDLGPKLQVLRQQQAGLRGRGAGGALAWFLPDPQGLGVGRAESPDFDSPLHTRDAQSRLARKMHGIEPASSRALSSAGTWPLN